MQRGTPIIAAAVAAALSLTACGSDADTNTDDGAAVEASADSLSISDARSREPASGQTNGVVYATVANSSDSDIRLVSATSPTTGTVELHETSVGDDGVMSMAEVEEGFVVPAGGEFVFEPGGPHVMLLGIDPETFPTDEVEVTLGLEGGESLTFSASVEAIDGMDMEGMDMDTGDMDDMGSDTDE